LVPSTTQQMIRRGQQPSSWHFLPGLRRALTFEYFEGDSLPTAGSLRAFRENFGKILPGQLCSQTTSVVCRSNAGQPWLRRTAGVNHDLSVLPSYFFASGFASAG
jgi:hypothetical protein